MSQRALANQAREFQLQRSLQWVRSGLLLLASVLSLGTVGLLAADQIYRPDSFVIEQLKIKGAFRYLQPQEVERVVREHEMGNFFSVQLGAIEHQVEQLAWVQSAQVRREWPGTLLIQVKEQRPVMRWGDSAWVNSVGEVVELPEHDFKTPVTLHGHPRDSRKMLEQSLAWQSLLNQSGLTLIGMRLSERHAYQLELLEVGSDKPFYLQLGRHKVQARLERFLMLYNSEFKSSAQRLQHVDARYPDGLAIRAEQLVEDQTLAKQGGDDE